MTTDKSIVLEVLSDGYSAYNAFNDHSSPHAENSNCNYVSNFRGVLAAPTVTGVIALMLGANPNLTWRDVKHILASNAVQVDASYGTSAIRGLPSTNG